MYMLVLLSFALLQRGIWCQAPDVREFCMRTLESPFSPCDTVQCRGRDGKRGPQGTRGASGSKGEKGDEGPGTETLVRDVASLEEQLKRSEKSSVLNFCGIGMKTGVIVDEDITVSSSSIGFRGKQWARADQQPIASTSSGAWCPDTNDGRKWIKIDFGAPKEISGILTQGSPSENHWTETYSMSCGDANGRFSDFTEYGSVKIFTGNSDRNTKSVNFFAEKIKCRYVRIHLRTWNRRACMRLEILRGICYSPEYYSFYVESAGYDDGNTGKVFINGVDHADRGIGRAHCVVVFNPRTKAVTAKPFDTYSSVAQTNAMVRFIVGVPDYSIIAVALMDSTNPEYITDEASSLFKSLGAVGSACNTKPEVRDAWAFITQKIRPGDVRPPWVQCLHVPRYGGKATLHATITTSAHHDSWSESPIA